MARPNRFRDKWRIRWFDENGKRRSAVFDTHREAEYQLRQHQLEVEDIRRGNRRRKPEPKRFSELCDRWLADRVPEKRSGRDDKSIIRCHLRPAFGHLPLTGINGADVRVEYVRSKRGRSPKTINNHLTLLISMLNYAKDVLGWLDRVPRIAKLPATTNRERYRFLKSEVEIRRFLVAARNDSVQTHALYATAVYTGLRAGELAGLRWRDVSFETRLITVHRSYVGTTKSARSRIVPILDALLPTLRSWKLLSGEGHVFKNRDGRMFQPSARVFQEVLHRVLDEAGFERTESGRRYITFHDLRHTFASHWMMNGGDLFKLQRILGHAGVETTQRYAHLSPTAFAADHARLGSGSDGREAVVTRLPRIAEK